MNVGGLHRNLPATFELHSAAELAGRQARQSKVPKGGPGLRDGEAGPSRAETPSLERTANRRRQQRRRHPVNKRAVREEDLGVARQLPTAALQDFELTRPQVEGEACGHWKLSQVTTDDVPTSVMRAVRLRFVPVAVTVTFQVAPLP